MWQCDDEKCVICDTPPNTDDPETAITFEHIIPESLGNHNFGATFLCKKCNGKLGTLVDATLCNHTVIAAIRLLYNIAGKSGGFPKIHGVVDDNSPASIVNGELKFQNYLQEVEEGRFAGSAATNNQAVAMITKSLERRGYNAETITRAQNAAKSLSATKITDPIFSADVTFDRYEFALPFAKMAYEYALVKLGPSYKNDIVGNMLKDLIYSFIKDSGDTSLLDDMSIVSIYRIVDDHMKRNNFTEEMYPVCLTEYANKCFEHKGVPAHALKIRQTAHHALLADIVLFCHPFFHYAVPITLNASLYQYTEDVDYIICHTNILDEKEKEALKLVLMENENCIFGFPPINEN